MISRRLHIEVSEAFRGAFTLPEGHVVIRNRNFLRNVARVMSDQYASVSIAGEVLPNVHALTSCGTCGREDQPIFREPSQGKLPNRCHPCDRDALADRGQREQVKVDLAASRGRREVRNMKGCPFCDQPRAGGNSKTCGDPDCIEQSHHHSKRANRERSNHLQRQSRALDQYAYGMKRRGLDPETNQCLVCKRSPGMFSPVLNSHKVCGGVQEDAPPAKVDGRGPIRHLVPGSCEHRYIASGSVDNHVIFTSNTALLEEIKGLWKKDYL